MAASPAGRWWARPIDQQSGQPAGRDHRADPARSPADAQASRGWSGRRGCNPDSISGQHAVAARQAPRPGGVPARRRRTRRHPAPLRRTGTNARSSAASHGGAAPTEPALNHRRLVPGGVMHRTCHAPTELSGRTLFRRPSRWAVPLRSPNPLELQQPRAHISKASAASAPSRNRLVDERFHPAHSRGGPLQWRRGAGADRVRSARPGTIGFSRKLGRDGRRRWVLSGG